MTTNSSSSEPIPGGSEAVSGAVSEYVAARRLGLSVDTLRRDRRTGHLGIPFIKYGEGKRGCVRYDLADLERFVEAKKRAGRAPVATPQPPLHEPPAAQPEPPAAQPEPHDEPPVPHRVSPPRTMWEALAERVQAEPQDDPQEEPFAVAGRAAPRRKPGGYFGG